MLGRIIVSVGKDIVQKEGENGVSKRMRVQKSQPHFQSFPLKSVSQPSDV